MIARDCWPDVLGLVAGVSLLRKFEGSGDTQIAQIREIIQQYGTFYMQYISFLFYHRSARRNKGM